jgi:hypothetical protein
MELEGSLLRSQEPSSGPYPEQNQSSPYHPILSKIQFNIILPPAFRSSKLSLSFCLYHQNPICVPLVPIRDTCPVYLILLNLIFILKILRV